MKERFRVRFAIKGWEIQYSRWPLVWHSVGNMVWREKAVVERLAADLEDGLAPGAFYHEDDGDETEARK